MKKIFNVVVPYLAIVGITISILMSGVYLNKMTPKKLTIHVYDDVVYVDINKLEVTFAFSDEIVIFSTFQEMEEYISQLTANECR